MIPLTVPEVRRLLSLLSEPHAGMCKLQTKTYSVEASRDGPEFAAHERGKSLLELIKALGLLR